MRHCLHEWGAAWESTLRCCWCASLVRPIVPASAARHGIHMALGLGRGRRVASPSMVDECPVTLSDRRAMRQRMESFPDSSPIGRGDR